MCTDAVRHIRCEIGVPDDAILDSSHEQPPAARTLIRYAWAAVESVLPRSAPPLSQSYQPPVAAIAWPVGGATATAPAHVSPPLTCRCPVVAASCAVDRCHDNSAKVHCVAGDLAVAAVRRSALSSPALTAMMRRTCGDGL